MADQEVEVPASAEADVEMAGAEGEDAEVENGDNNEGTADAEVAVRTNPQNVFLDYLKSPIVELRVGGDDDFTILTAHSALLSQSPYFAAKLAEQTPAADTIQRISLSDASLDAVGCLLQYQYTGEYFPRRVPGKPEVLETDPSLPALDNTGDQLLKHARVYTLAEKLGLPKLKALAHSKIHRINSTASGEIAYARYVYANTPADDSTIRRPVAAFWATRSHVLRHEAEDDFRTMCLEYPQFGFDVLSLVLDQREKRSAARGEEETPSKGSARKRMRTSINV